jgi:hypothetical protein
MSPLGDSALALARKGMRVFPCAERSKDPLKGSHGYKDATTDERIIQSWWLSRPALNIGIATGQGSGVWVLDIDGDDGGEATLRELEAKFGELPPTVEAITGNGRHLYWRWPEGVEIRNSQERDDMPGIHVRGNGGYTVAPPSVHPTGRVYAWSVDSASEFASSPDWLIERINRNGKPVEARSPEDWCSFIGQDVDGSRRGAAIARLFGLLVRRGLDPVLALDICRMFNATRCQPPLDDSEVVRIANDIANREASRRERG